VKFYLN